MTKPPPVLPANEDPAIRLGYAVRDVYAAAVQEIRGDLRMTDLAKAENLAALWQAATDELATSRKDYESRRQARVAALETLVPVGPNLPAGISPADSAVLQSAFRQALDEAREANRDTRLKILNDATRFGDDVRLRAVLTAATDDGQSDVVDRWAAGHPELADQLAELVALRERAITDGMFVRQAFGPLPKPDEMNYLAGLQRQAQDDAGFEARGLYRRPAGATSPEHVLTQAKAKASAFFANVGR